MLPSFLNAPIPAGIVYGHRTDSATGRSVVIGAYESARTASWADQFSMEDLLLLQREAFLRLPEEGPFYITREDMVRFRLEKARHT